MKNFLRVIVVIMGIILGMYLGELAEGLKGIEFLAYGKEIGLKSPIKLDIVFLNFTFGFMCNLNIAGIIGFVASLFVVKKVIK